jgi:hypothetical protein
MSGFSADWLALREAADHRSRNRELANGLATRFQQRSSITTVDLGCGTGSNLRATAALLPDTQFWTLVDNDPALLEAAARTLSTWADTHRQGEHGLVLIKAGKTITVTFRKADLVRDLDAILDPAPDLVTASALFDLASAEFITRFAHAVAVRRSVFFTVLTYNGIQHFAPRTPSDQPMTGAFHRHQMGDKGFGASAGPTAAVLLADQFQMQGYSVLEGDSPWRLGAADAPLLRELAQGFAAAVRETKAIEGKVIDAWIARPKTGAEVGHTDTLAIPGTATQLSMEDDDDS